MKLSTLLLLCVCFIGACILIGKAQEPVKNPDTPAADVNKADKIAKPDPELALIYRDAQVRVLKIDAQIRDLIDQRNQAIQSGNAAIEALFKKANLKTDDYQLNPDTWEFQKRPQLEVKKEAKP